MSQIYTINIKYQNKITFFSSLSIFSLYRLHRYLNFRDKILQSQMSLAAFCGVGEG